MKVAVVLFNLGGPDSLDAVRPFLENLFRDPAIVSLPGFLRLPLAKLIASRRAPLARHIYAQMGGRSPILSETEAQAVALETVLQAQGHEARCFIAMRYWEPFTRGAVEAVGAFAPERVILLPLYPQYSTTTTRSSLAEWHREAARQGFNTPWQEVCCYPVEEGFVQAVADLLRAALSKAKPGLSYRVLFSAHGLPKRIVAKGDPYPIQVEHTADAVVANLAHPGLDWQICYQSRVGPLEWIGPATDAEVRRAGAEGKGVIVVPIAFVSEHSETLVELDIEYRRLACESGVPDYIRVPAVGTHPKFVGGLARLVTAALSSDVPVTCAPGRHCPPDRVCGRKQVPADA